jgi:sarcosine oxidase
VIVSGVGAHGSRAFYELADMGYSVLALDRFSPPHNFGSHTGETRAFRTALGEQGKEEGDTNFSELALRTRELVRKLEGDGHEELYRDCGLLTIAKEGTRLHHVDDYFGNIRVTSKRYGIPTTEYGDADALRQKLPQLNVRDHDYGILDQYGGYLHADRIIKAQIQGARKRGGVMKINSPMEHYTSDSDGVTVTTDRGDTYRARKLVIATGAWMTDFMPPEIVKDMTRTRQVLYWFEIQGDPSRFYDTNMPVVIWDVAVPEAQRVTGDEPKSELYFFPIREGGKLMFKAASEETGKPVDPNFLSRLVGPHEIDRMRRVFLKQFIPGVGPHCMRTAVGIYTNLPGAQGIADWIDPHVLAATGCSGHFFKLSGGFGEGIASMVAESLGGKPKQGAVDLSRMSIEKYLERRAAKKLEGCDL